MPRPIFPNFTESNALADAFEKDAKNPVNDYIHRDLQNKCAQERALGFPCDY